MTETENIFSYIAGAETQDLQRLAEAIDAKLAQTAVVSTFSDNAPVVVAAGVKYLTPKELEQATEAFSAWRHAAKKPVQTRSRSRIWLAFLLVRYGGLRLGEVLAFDDQLDMFPAESRIVVRGASQRTVALPQHVMQEILKTLDLPMLSAERGKVLQLDPGYVRRTFYERAKACSMPASLFNPRSFRDSRAIELLCGGVPLQAVQAFLGRQNLNSTASYLDFSEETASRFVHLYLTKEMKMKTSARNAFSGKVTRLVHDGLLVEVELTTNSGLTVVAVITDESFTNLGLAQGTIATATVKAPWVILAQHDSSFTTSARNKYAGTVVSVKSSALAAEIVASLADGTKVCALVTQESVKNLDLKEGSAIQVMFKAFSVIVNVQ